MCKGGGGDRGTRISTVFVQTEALPEVGGDKDSAKSVDWGKMRASLRRYQGVGPALQHQGMRGKSETGKMGLDLCEGRTHSFTTTLLPEPLFPTPLHHSQLHLLQP